MATVPTSKDNINDIKNHIRGLKHDAFKQTWPNGGPSTELSIASSDIHDELVWGELVEWRNQHKEVFNERDTFTLSVSGLTQLATTLVVRSTIGKVFYTRPDKESTYLGVVYANLVTMADYGVPDVQLVLDRLHELKETHEFNAKWTKLESDVTHFFSQYGSVNQALKAAPSMGIYCPSWMHDKIAEKVVRPKREAPAVTIDVGAITAVAVEVKLGGA